jgi:hypothetical protein
MVLVAYSGPEKAAAALRNIGVCHRSMTYTDINRTILSLGPLALYLPIYIDIYRSMMAQLDEDLSSSPSRAQPSTRYCSNKQS